MDEMNDKPEDLIESESKKDKFIRLAESRVTKARVAISRLTYLANTSSYDYTTEQVEQMIAALEKEIDNVKQSFQKAEKPEKVFSFESL